jgi:hypothetical protein
MSPCIVHIDPENRSPAGDHASLFFGRGPHTIAERSAMTMDTRCIAVCREIASPVATTLQMQATSLTDPLGKTACTGFLVSSSWLLNNRVRKLSKRRSCFVLAVSNRRVFSTEQCSVHNCTQDPSLLNGKMKVTDNYRRRNAHGGEVYFRLFSDSGQGKDG